MAHVASIAQSAAHYLDELRSRWATREIPQLRASVHEANEARSELKGLLAASQQEAARHQAVAEQRTAEALKTQQGAAAELEATRQELRDCQAEQREREAELKARLGAGRDCFGASQLSINTGIHPVLSIPPTAYPSVQELRREAQEQQAPARQAHEAHGAVKGELSALCQHQQERRAAEEQAAAEAVAARRELEAEAGRLQGQLAAATKSASEAATQAAADQRRVKEATWAALQRAGRLQEELDAASEEQEALRSVAEAAQLQVPSPIEGPSSHAGALPSGPPKAGSSGASAGGGGAEERAGCGAKLSPKVGGQAVGGGALAADARPSKLPRQNSSAPAATAAE
eukprot:scaffold34.g4513.t1